MSRSRYPKIKSFCLWVLIIGAAYIYKQWCHSEDTLWINGGNAEVIDGDSFKIKNDAFRIHGVDAPEYLQICKDPDGVNWSCGKSARSGLERILRKGNYHCVVQTRDQYGRLVVQCKSEAGTDLSAQLVTAGWAVSGESFDGLLYPVEEADAQKARRGVWRGEFVRPDIWRAQNPRN